MSLAIARERFTALLGANGTGKSTLLKTLLSGISAFPGFWLAYQWDWPIARRKWCCSASSMHWQWSCRKSFRCCDHNQCVERPQIVSTMPIKIPMTAGNFFQPFASWKKYNPPANATSVLARRRLITSETSASGFRSAQK